MDKKRPSEEEVGAKKARLEEFLHKQDPNEALRLWVCAAIEDGILELQRNPTCLDILFELSCCGRCMLRVLGIRNYEVYRLSSMVIKFALLGSCKKLVETQEMLKTQKKENTEPICPICVGTVQLAESFVDDIVERIQKENYVTKTFNMNVTMPTSTLVRNHALSVYWREKLAGSPVDLVDIKEIFKLLISWPVEEKTGLTLDFSSELRLQVSVSHEETKDDHVFLSTMPESGMIIKSKREKRKMIVVGDGRHNIVRALSLVSDTRFKAVGKNVPPAVVTTKPILESIEMTRDSVHVGGRYLKYSRDVSQTPWTIGTTVLAELSVSGIVCDAIKKVFRADDFKFVTAGREDANVRMLGNGRPFYMELINPRTPSVPQETLDKVQEEINAIMPEKVQIRKLTSLKSEDTKIIKDGEDTKTKSYSALCWASEPVTQTMLDAVNAYNSKAFIVEQQTPIRVLQRRAQMIRKKEIHSLKAFPLQGHFFVVHLHTEAGTYIKEFVHGDLGRNQPSLASILGCEADIMELDVLEVDLEFPPTPANSTVK
ncbi:putative tRNA pseudouridine synthase Pus10 [Gryganskiella cystojenkinii]|nr:putative tRNA pseudouridine synthase Pus10 [Gryganskiella cystojenkinii]